MKNYNGKNGGRNGERGERRFGEKKPFGGRPFEGKPRFDGERNFGERGERRFGEKKPFGGKPFEGKPRFDGERSFGERNFGERGERRFGEKKPFGGRPFEGKPRFDGERNFGERSFGERGERRFGEKKPFGGKPFEGKPRFEGERNFGERGERRFGEKKPFGGRPFEGRPRFDGERRPFEGKPRFEGEHRPFEGRPRFDDRPHFESRGFMQETPADPENLPNIIMGRNPVREAVKSGRSIDRILVTAEHDGSLGEIVALAREKNIVIRETDRRKLDELCMPFGHDGKPGNHQGIVAEIPGVEYAELSDILAYAEEKGEKPFVILLDGIEDPHNLGSIIRSAECAGAHGVVIPKRRSAPVTATVVKTSAGAAEHMRIARVVNIVSAMEQLKQAGLWIAGADMAGESMYKTDMKGGFALVIGGEGDGLGKLVKEKCDFLVSIPLRGSIDSLNAAVAAAIIMFEKNRQDAQ
ncbi:MAG: 23S rRNA (guanosine(2251)-2'-O)-methyltransferase RlmB [Clostridia bacterium]|nr:23S rRNA (guanosine(2251)-2'-O)-methyltransferase RlmB [Clostridia bacterium]